jgi:uncharacterized tellurite resistance protein B-like protein
VQAYRDGKLSKDEADVLALLRQRFGLTADELEVVAQEARLEIYTSAMADVWQDGVITEPDCQRLDRLREVLDVTAEEHVQIEREMRLQAMKREASKTPKP